jgi:hypothetical protein
MLEAEVVGEGDGKAAEDFTLPRLQRPLLSIIYKFMGDTFFTSTKYSKTRLTFLFLAIDCETSQVFVSLRQPLQCSQN